MIDWPERLKKDIIDARNKVKEARVSITGGVVEEKAKQVGKNAVDVGKDTLQKIDESLSDVTEKLATGAYQVGDKAKGEAGELAEDVKAVRQMVREKRREMTGGVVEDKVVESLNDAEKKLEEIVQKMKED
jgi:hypothetical protein